MKIAEQQILTFSLDNNKKGLGSVGTLLLLTHRQAEAKI